jgi:hypothetical protein
MIALMILAMAAAGEPALRAELEPMRFLVGHCWRGELDHGKAIDTHCFEPVFGGQHIRDRHEVSGGYRGETLYSRDVRTGGVEYSYWNSFGGVIRGTMTVKAGVLHFTGEVIGDGGASTRYGSAGRGSTTTITT